MPLSELRRMVRIRISSDPVVTVELQQRVQVNFRSKLGNQNSHLKDGKLSATAALNFFVVSSLFSRGSPATGADLQPGARDVRPDPVPSVDIQARPVAAVDPLPPRADQDKGVFSALKRMPDLLRPDPPASTGETLRPPMPVGTASPEIK